MSINIGDMANVHKVKSSDKDLTLTKIKDNSFEYRGNNEQKLEEVNNIKELLVNLDKDEVQQDNLTTIDFNTRLGQSEISSIVALQLLHTMKVGGKVCSLITRSIKRHKVSLGGLGRKEKVQIIQGEREHDEGKSSLFGKIKGFMGGNGNENNQK